MQRQASQLPATRCGAQRVASCRTRLVVGACSLALVGALLGPAAAWAASAAELPVELSLTNAALVVTFRTGDATLTVKDRRLGATWRQAGAPGEVQLERATVRADQQLEFTGVSAGCRFESVIQLDGDRPELTQTLDGTNRLTQPLRFPRPFVTDAGTYLVVPMNEGISFPVDDASIAPMRLIAYGGHGICMAFWGVTDGGAGHMALLETPDDAAIRIQRQDQRLCIAPEWDSQQGNFGYVRRLRYVFFDRGGYVAMCRRYRAYAEKLGRVRTLTAKAAVNPNVDRLIGAVNVWCWESDARPLVREMQGLGLERILWSNRQSPAALADLNAWKVLTSRYDIYQDTMDPQNFKFLRGVHPDWTTEAWPQDLMLGANGDWTRGWGVKGTNGQWYYCGVLCDQRAPAYAKRRIPAELETHPYRCRFIDTTTASPWRECYHPAHPMTRAQSRHYKMELLRYVCDDLNLVTGCETGHDAAVPYVHYFEGMLSLGPYRVPDAGRDMQRMWTEVPEAVAKFQLGQRYRLPLWELVFHDCVVAQWYWGDYNNKLPALWDKRDLFNVLYGTPPMFMFNRAVWEQNKSRFVQSYRNVCPLVRAVGYAPMIDHQFLTPDRDVQRTRFGNGVSVTVNFGATPRSLPDGPELAALSFRLEGL